MTENNGKYHNKKENRKRVSFYCPYCNKSFKSKAELSLHMLCCRKGE